MKPDRRTLVIGSAVIAGAMALSVREQWRTAGGGRMPLESEW